MGDIAAILAESVLPPSSACMPRAPLLIAISSTFKTMLSKDAEMFGRPKRQLRCADTRAAMKVRLLRPDFGRAAEH